MSAYTNGVTWELEREIVLCRVYDAPREKVYRAWTDPDAVAQWFGPDGFTCTVLEMDVRVGGRWRFIYDGPDGTRWDNRITYLEVVENERLVFDHGSDVDDDPGRFRVAVVFEAQSDGKTVLTMRQLHPTVEQRNAGIDFGAVELGYQTLAHLADYLDVGRRPIP
ncbi:MAG: SRPBCC family protein [Acidimicrobiia bacterium]